MDYDERVLDKLRPTFEGQYMQRRVEPKVYSDGKVYHTTTISDNLGSLRGTITQDVRYNPGEKTQLFYLNYEWDVDNDAWVLLDFIPPGTHKDEFPWRKGLK